MKRSFGLFTLSSWQFQVALKTVFCLFFPSLYFSKNWLSLVSVECSFVTVIETIYQTALLCQQLKSLFLTFFFAFFLFFFNQIFLVLFHTGMAKTSEFFPYWKMAPSRYKRIIHYFYIQFCALSQNAATHATREPVPLVWKHVHLILFRFYCARSLPFVSVPKIFPI